MLRNAIAFCCLITAFVAAATPIAGWASAEESKGGTYFLIGPKAMSVPVGYLVLIRKSGAVGAFRFLSVSEASGPGAIGSSRYESFMLVRQPRDGGWSVDAMRIADLDIQELRGIHAFARQPGKNKLRVGHWSFGCYGRHLVNMSSGFAEKDEGYEFAPTAFTDVKNVDPASGLLHWYRFDSNTVARVAVTTLPGGDSGGAPPR